MQEKNKISRFNILSGVGSLASIFGLLFYFIPIKHDVSQLQEDLSALRYDYNQVFNQQFIDTSKLSNLELVELYYDSINAADFDTACSLIHSRNCDQNDKQQLTQRVEDKLGKRHHEYKDGVEVTKSRLPPDNEYEITDSSIVCVETKFTIRNEETPVYQVWQHKVLERPDGGKQIIDSRCEIQNKGGYINPTVCLAAPQICQNSKH